MTNDIYNLYIYVYFLYYSIESRYVDYRYRLLFIKLGGVRVFMFLKCLLL